MESFINFFQHEFKVQTSAGVTCKGGGGGGGRLDSVKNNFVDLIYSTYMYHSNLHVQVTCSIRYQKMFFFETGEG